MGQENGAYAELAVTEKNYLRLLLMSQENGAYAGSLPDRPADGGRKWGVRWQ